MVIGARRSRLRPRARTETLGTVLGRGDAPGMTIAARSGVIPEHWPRRRRVASDAAGVVADAGVLAYVLGGERRGEPGRSSSFGTSSCDAVSTLFHPPLSVSRITTVTTRFAAQDPSSNVNRPWVTIQPASPAC